jgi:sulfatase maturation enzyme AslB (radical SAM superfamily)
MTTQSLTYILKILLNLKLDGKHKTWCINFSGGEPLLNFSVLEETITKLYKKYKPILPSMGITTNLTILPETFIQFCYTKNFFVLASLDSLHTSKRYKSDNSPTAKDVMNNIKLLLDDHIPVTVQTVILHTNNTINELGELAEYVANNGIKWNLNIDYFMKESEYTRIKYYYDKIKQAIIVLRKKRYNMKFFQFNKMRRGLLYSSLPFAIINDGRVYPHVPIKDGHIGHVDNLLETLEQNYTCANNVFYYENREQCNQCDFSFICHADKVLPNKISEFNCTLNREIIKFMYKEGI